MRILICTSGLLGIICAWLVSLDELRQTTKAADYWRDAYMQAAAERRAVQEDMRRMRELLR